MKGGLMFPLIMNRGPIAVHASQSTESITAIEKGGQAYGISIASKDALKWSSIKKHGG